MLVNRKVRTLALAIAVSVVAGSALAGPGQSGNGPGSRSAQRALAAIDSNGDGTVTLDEFAAASVARALSRFDARDANGDGLITTDELGERPEPPDEGARDAFRQCVADALGVEVPDGGEPGDRFDFADVNGDGAIDAAEAEAVAMERALTSFDRLDANADGVLVIAEFRRSLGRTAALRAIRRDCRQAQQDVDDLLGV